MGRTRPLLPLAMPDTPEVLRLLPDLAELLADRGPARLPVPEGDPVRSKILIEAMGAGSHGQCAEVDARAVLVACTSGSTGLPKGALLSAPALSASAAATTAFLGASGSWILALPSHHIAGLQVLLRAIQAGTEPVVMDLSEGFNPHALPAAVSAASNNTGDATGPDSRRRYISLVPGQLTKILACNDSEAIAALAELDAVLLGGAAVSPTLLDQAHNHGVSVVRTYGMSETAGGCVYDGQPLDGVRVDVDDTTRVWLSGPQLALGYANAPEHPDFARPGWFRTADSGRIDSENRLHIEGRLDQALSVGGLTLLPQVVEDALRTHPAVADAVVVGLPDPRLGSRPVAAVALRAEATDAESLSAHVSAKLGNHSAPTEILLLDALPLLPSGKVDRLAISAVFSRRDSHNGRIDK